MGGWHAESASGREDGHDADQGGEGERVRDGGDLGVGLDGGQEAGLEAAAYGGCVAGGVEETDEEEVAGRVVDPGGGEPERYGEHCQESDHREGGDRELSTTSAMCWRATGVR